MLIWFRKRGWLVIAIVMVVSPVVIASVSDHNMNTSFDYGIIRCIYGFSAGILAFNIYNLYLREPSAFYNRVTTTIAEVTSLADHVNIRIYFWYENYFSARSLCIFDRCYRILD